VLSISPCSLITLLFSSSYLLIDFLTCLCFSKPKKYELFVDKEKLDCDGEVTDTKFSEAIGNMKLNKYPGLDGLTVEFYRAFWEKLKIVLPIFIIRDTMKL
jgi:hypothetical protein